MQIILIIHHLVGHLITERKKQQKILYKVGIQIDIDIAKLQQILKTSSFVFSLFL